jgi:phosphatidylglycerophosphate synthase
MEEFKATGFKKYLPNILSCIRIIGAFALPFLMWKSWEIEITLPFINKTLSNVPIIWSIVFFILLSSDKLDGWLARKLKAESELGAAFDIVGDTLVIAVGATLCFGWFNRDKLETWRFWLYIGMVAASVINKALVFFLARIYHGKSNMVHTYFQKLFAAGCYVAIFLWVFFRTIPEWSVYSLMAINIYATIDESVYCIRSAEYDVDFKGHGFETYKKRATITA